MTQCSYLRNTFCLLFPNCYILVRTDNTTVLAYIKTPVWPSLSAAVQVPFSNIIMWSSAHLFSVENQICERYVGASVDLLPLHKRRTLPSVLCAGRRRTTRGGRAGTPLIPANPNVRHPTLLSETWHYESNLKLCTPP